MEWASLSMRGLPVRAPQACRTGAAMANPTNSSAKNMWMIIVRPTTSRDPPSSEKAFERSTWARRIDKVAAPTLYTPSRLLRSRPASLHLALADAVQGGLVDGAGLQPPVHDVVHRAPALQGLPDRPQQPPLARRGEDENLPHLELVVPGAGLLRGRLHLREDRGDPHPRQRAHKQYPRQREKDHERRYPDGGRRDGE